MSKEFTILLEEDYAQNNISAYVPELRLNVVGDTEEETIKCVRDLIQIELRKSPNHKQFHSKVVTILVDIDSTKQDIQAAVS